MRVGAIQVYLRALSTPVALIVQVKVANVHASEVALTQCDLLLAYSTVDVFSHVKVSVAALTGLRQSGIVQRVPLIAFFWLLCFLFFFLLDNHLEKTVDMVDCRWP